MPVYERIKHFEKTCITSGFEPWTLCTQQGCLDHQTTSVDTHTAFYMALVCELGFYLHVTCRLMSNVRRRPRRARPPPAMTHGPSRQPGPGLHLDLLDAQVCHGFVAGMWRRTLVWLRNMQQWESSESPVDLWLPHRPVGPQLKLWARAGWRTMQGEGGFPPLERQFMVCFQFNWVIVFLSPLYF